MIPRHFIRTIPIKKIQEDIKKKSRGAIFTQANSKVTKTFGAHKYLVLSMQNIINRQQEIEDVEDIFTIEETWRNEGLLAKNLQNFKRQKICDHLDGKR